MLERYLLANIHHRTASSVTLMLTGTLLEAENGEASSNQSWVLQSWNHHGWVEM